MTVGGRRRRVALPDPTDTAAAWSWTAIMDTLEAVQRDPQTAIATARARAGSGPRFADDAELELFLDMPDTRRSGRAGPPKNPATVRIPPIPSIEHDSAFFDLLDGSPDPGRRARSTPEDGSGYDDPVRRSGRGPARPAADRGRCRHTRAATWKPVELSVTQRHDLIDVWTTMFTDVYVHYTQKARPLRVRPDPRAVGAATTDPVPRLGGIPPRAHPADQPAP